MASKFCFSFLVFFLYMHFCTFSLAQTLPVMEFITAFPKESPPVVEFICEVGFFKTTPHIFKPVDKYQLKVSVNDIYYCNGWFGKQFAAIHGFEPARDKGRATVFWKIDLYGFSISYDNSTFKKVAPWESE